MQVDVWRSKARGNYFLFVNPGVDPSVVINPNRLGPEVSEMRLYRRSVELTAPAGLTIDVGVVSRQLAQRGYALHLKRAASK